MSNTGIDANAGNSPSQPTLSNCDKKIMKAMSLFANVLRSARREADETTVSGTRRAELEAWIERHAADIDAHIEVSRHIPPKNGKSKKDLTSRTEAWSFHWPWR
jgi:hypothetical protein